MSETVLKIRIGELGIVRLICKNQKCGAVTEFQISKPLQVDMCPGCHQPFVDMMNRPGKNPMARVLDALREFEQLKPPVDVEFVIPVKP